MKFNGKYLKQLRKEFGYSQKVLGEIINKSSQLISRWEQKGEKPTCLDLRKLSYVFGVDMEEFIEITEEDEDKIWEKIEKYK